MYIKYYSCQSSFNGLKGQESTESEISLEGVPDLLIDTNHDGDIIVE